MKSAFEISRFLKPRAIEAENFHFSWRQKFMRTSS